MNCDQRMMQRCLELARRAREAGDHPFGAVVVDADGHVVSEGRNREVTESDVSWHAEMEAIKKVTTSRRNTSLEAMTLYTNGQPCIMCSAVIRFTGISRVVFGARARAPYRAHPHPLTDPEFGQLPPPTVEGGLMAEESLEVQGRQPDRRL